MARKVRTWKRVRMTDGSSAYVASDGEFRIRRWGKKFMVEHEVVIDMWNGLRAFDTLREAKEWAR